MAVLSDDPFTRDAAFARLSQYREVTLPGIDDQRHAQVLLVLAEQVSDGLLRRMESAHRDRAEPDLACVLVATRIQNRQVLRAIGSGLVCLLDRAEVGYDRIVRAIVAAHRGRAEFPATVQRLFVEQLRAVRRDTLTPYGWTASGFAVRELEVLGLLSEGLSTGEVAAKLNYSTRTVKYIIHGVLSRCELRNRTHAVAYALRCGAL